jgi:hypothetical protein
MPYTDIYIDDRDAVSRTREEAPSLIERAACAGVEMLKFGAGRQTVLVRSEGCRSTIRGRGSHERVLRSLSSGPGGKQSTLVNMGMEVDPHRMSRIAASSRSGMHSLKQTHRADLVTLDCFYAGWQPACHMHIYAIMQPCAIKVVSGAASK